MLGIVGKSILLGLDSASPTSTNVTPIKSVTLRNANFEYLNATKNKLDDLPHSLPIEWMSHTIMDVDFQNLNAGNLGFISEAVSRILVQRIRTDIPGEWITLFEIPVESQNELKFVVNDFTNVAGARYKYRFLPILRQGDIEIEGSGVPTNEIYSNFDGVFICDQDTFIKLYAGVDYGTIQATQVTGVHDTLNNKYPIIVANSNAGYKTGSISATILNKDYGELNPLTNSKFDLDERKILEHKKEIEEFLLNKKPKILKDYAGNIWLCYFPSAVNYDFFNAWGKSLGTMSTDWVEIGDPEEERDLRRTGLIGGAN